MEDFKPAYLDLLESGELERRVASGYDRLERCEICPQICRCNRRIGKKGICRTGERARLSSYGPHMGEENPLRGWRGSGTIFFAGCNLRCQYCQNHDISQSETTGAEVEPDDLAAVMLELQAYGCHNINLVSPTHVVPQILAALLIAAKAGLRLPLVYNTGGYDSLETLALLDGIMDIYMPDMKYANAQIARRYSKCRNYPQVNQAAVREMHRQVGDLQLSADGLAIHGLLVRHLILPKNLAGSQEVMDFLVREISANTYLNVMDQYLPNYNAHLFPKLNRPIKASEYQETLNWAERAGLHRLEP